jgi:peptidoglycan/LPS O-acetylase OafA/YrhL
MAQETSAETAPEAGEPKRGGFRLLAEQGFFPEFFGARSRLGPKAGLIITTALVLVVANLVDLGAIASVGSAVSLMVFVLVAVAGYRRRADTQSNTLLVVPAIGVTAVVLAVFAVDTARNEPETFGAILAIAVVAILLDAVSRRPGPRAAPPAGQVRGEA